jgi:hypothetical protein
VTPQRDLFFYPMEDATLDGEGFQPYVMPDGISVLADAETRAFFEGRDRSRPLQADLDRAWAKAGRATLIEGGTRAGKALGATVLLEVSDAHDLEALQQLTAIDETKVGFHCLCYGDLALVLKSTGSADLLVLGIHHGESIRWDGWNSDADLARGRDLLEWLAARGVEEPLRQYLENERRGREAVASFYSWLAATPEPLQYLIPQIDDLRQSGDLLDAESEQEAEARLNLWYPSGTERTEVLLRWFGSGSGRINGYPTYEAIPTQFLHHAPLTDLIAAIERGDSDVVAGGVRLLAGRNFHQDREDELLALPPVLRGTLLASALQSGDEDKIERARQAFEVRESG